MPYKLPEKVFSHQGAYGNNILVCNLVGGIEVWILGGYFVLTCNCHLRIFHCYCHLWCHMLAMICESGIS